MTRAKHTKAPRWPFVSAALIMVFLGLLFVFDAYLESKTITSPSPHATADVYEDEFPVVDWEHWRSINADIIGWITIPGTTIDSPIVQAQPSDPQRYLWTDVYGNWNPYGAIYLDAACIENGLRSQNSVIYGHNMGSAGTAMFAELANMISYDYAVTHSEILIQTPEEADSAKVCFTEITQGSASTKRTTFTNLEDFLSWYRKRQANAVSLLTDTQISKVYSLVTCSYNYFSNERTIVYADATTTPQTG